MRFIVQFHDRPTSKRRSAFLDNLVEYIKDRAPIGLTISAEEDEATIYVFLQGAKLVKLNYPKTEVVNWAVLGNRVMAKILPPGGGSLDARMPGEMDDVFRKRMMRRMMGK